MLAEFAPVTTSEINRGDDSQINPGDGEPVAPVATAPLNSTHFTPQLIASLVAVYVFWGSTYLAIGRAIATVPPFIMASMWFLVAGLLLVAWQTIVRRERISRKAILPAGIIAFLLLLGGNGGVVWSEKYLSSGMTALLVGAAPFWFVLLDWLWLKSPRPTLIVTFALILGFFGLALLIYPTLKHSGHPNEFWGAAAVMLAALSWSLGSIYSKRVEPHGSPLMVSGLQMLWGSVILAATALLSGETRGFSFAAVTAESWYSVLYLIIFGSLVGYTSYIYVLKHATPAVTSTYAYVNPVVAVFLGWALNNEPVHTTTLIAAGLIVVAVIMISLKKRA